MRHTGIQPQYFPRLHYFSRILNADIFVLRDEVQFTSNHKYPDGRRGKSYQAHCPIKQSSGVQLLTVPIKHNGFSPLTTTQISYEHTWVRDHLNTLRYSYANAANYVQIYPEIEELLKLNYETFAELNTATILWGILHFLGEKNIKPELLTIDYVNSKLKEQKVFRLKEIKRASQLQSAKKNQDLSPNEKIVSILKEVGASEDYIGGTALAAYVDKELFEKNGINITLQDWRCQKYHQLFEKQCGFIPNLSIIDLLMNVDHKQAIKIISG